MSKFFGILLIYLVWNITTVLAVPAERKMFTVWQTDGKALSVVLQGDENLHYYMTADSVPVFKTEHGYCYGYILNNELIVSKELAHDKNERKASEKLYVKQASLINDFLKVKLSDKLIPGNQRRLNKRNIGTPKKFIGSKKGLVILVNFANLSMNGDNVNHTFDDLFNKEGYSENGSVGSVHDYFYDQSYGKFDLSFDVVGPVTLSRNYEYYGSNSLLYGDDRNAREMVVEACQLVDEQVDFKKYDWDGDGEVDQVFIVYAGYGEHAGASSNTIWPHESILGNKTITLDGVSINTYACSCELKGNSGERLCGIGTPCHEFSHCLGLPDLYDTDYSGAFGMSYWDIMNSGSHSGPKAEGEIPYGYSAYERWFAGWLEMDAISTTQHIDALPNIADTPKAYLIYNEGNHNEYYILENHQPTKWFSYVKNYTGMHGLMITHVDYDAKAWAANSVNPSPQHQRMSIVPADNSYGESEAEFGGDLYPGQNGVVLLNNTSHLNVGGKLFNMNVDGSFNLNRTISGINEKENGVISFNVVFKEEVPSPIDVYVSEANVLGYHVNWNHVSNADYYMVEQDSYKIGQNYIPIRKTQIVDKIYDTHIFMEWLTDGITNVRVKAVVNGFESDWSERIEVPRVTSKIENITNNSLSQKIYYDLNGILHKKRPLGLGVIRGQGELRKVIFK